MDKVYVLLEAGQTSPVAVFSDPLKLHHEFLPKDAVARTLNRKQSYGHREIIGEWSSVMHGTTFRLVCYVVL